jgi:predicted NAD-dependent protein-ADP-ribosyltransferase YbiA (DUF1768 family)
MPKANDLKQFILMERQQRNNLAAFNLLAKKEDAVEELRGYLNSNNKRSTIFHIDDLKYGQPTNVDLELMTSRLKLLQTSFDDLSIPEPFKNSSEEVNIELKFIRMLRKLSEDPETIRNIDEEDKDLLAPFLRFARANNLPVDESFLRLLLHDINVLTIRFKYMFNRPRPQQLAAHKNLELITHEGESANIPSYPSGHSVAGRVLGKAMGDRYPSFSEDFEKIGAAIGLHRLIAGLHYPTDHAAGVMLGDQIHSKGLVNDHVNFMMPDAEELVQAVQQAVAIHAEGFNLNKSIDDMSVLVDIFKAEGDTSKRHIYVFGSNLDGQNYGGAAKRAWNFGASRNGIEGDAEDRIEGDTYSLSTKISMYSKNVDGDQYMTIEDMQPHLNKFAQFVADNPYMVFHIANLGMNMGGFTTPEEKKQVGDAFTNAFKAIGLTHVDLKDRLLFDENPVDKNGKETQGLADVAFDGNLPHDPTTFEMPKERWVDPESDIGIDKDNHPINSFNSPQYDKNGNLTQFTNHSFLSNFSLLRDDSNWDNKASVGGWLWKAGTDKEAGTWEEDNESYPSTEHAFQASKFTDPTIRERIRKASGPRGGPSPAKAKKIATDNAASYAVTYHGPEEEDLMGLILRDKFTNNKGLARQLLETKERTLIEGNTHGDHWWGNNGNRLGKLLMDIRGELLDQYPTSDAFDANEDWQFDTRGGEINYDYLRSPDATFPLREHFPDGQIPLTSMDFDKVVPMSYEENAYGRSFKEKPTGELTKQLNGFQRELEAITGGDVPYGGELEDKLRYENLAPRIQRTQDELKKNTDYNRLLENVGNAYNLMLTGDGTHRTSTTRRREGWEDISEGSILGVRDPAHEGKDFKGFLAEVLEVTPTEDLTAEGWSGPEAWQAAYKDIGEPIWENGKNVGNKSFNNGEFITVRFRIMNDKAKDSEQAVRHWLEAKHSFETPPEVDSTTLPDGGYTNHTGNAKGTDMYGAKALFEAGITGTKGRSIGHSYNGHTMDIGHSQYSDRYIHTDMHIDPEVLDRVARAHVRMAEGGTDRNPFHRASKKKIHRNWFQIANADGVYAISKGFEGDNVSGGTGWGVAMGIGRGIPVHVFDQPTHQWYTWDNDEAGKGGQEWIETSEPLPAYQDFALIGTRELNYGGKNAIDDLVANLGQRQEAFLSDQTPYDKPEILQTGSDISADELFAHTYPQNQKTLQDMSKRNEFPNLEITEDNVPKHIIDYNENTRIWGELSRGDIEEAIRYRGLEAQNQAVEQYKLDHDISVTEYPQTWQDLKDIDKEESRQAIELKERVYKRDRGWVRNPDGEWIVGSPEQTGKTVQRRLRYEEYGPVLRPEHRETRFWGIPGIESSAASYIISALNRVSPSPLNRIDVDSHPQLRVLFGENLDGGGGSMILPQEDIKWVENILDQQTWRNSIHHTTLMAILETHPKQGRTVLPELKPGKPITDMLPEPITPDTFTREREEAKLGDEFAFGDRTYFFESESGVTALESLNGTPGESYSGLAERLSTAIDLSYHPTHYLFVDAPAFGDLVGSGKNRLTAGDRRENIDVKGHLMEIRPMADEELERLAQGGAPRQFAPTGGFVGTKLSEEPLRRYDEYTEPYALNKDRIEWEGGTKFVPVDELDENTKIIRIIRKAYTGQTPEEIDADYVDKEFEGDSPYIDLDMASITPTEKGNFNVSLQVGLPVEDLKYKREWDEENKRWNQIGIISQLQELADAVDPTSYENPTTPTDVAYRTAKVETLFEYIDSALRTFSSDRQLAGGSSLMYNIAGETVPPEIEEVGGVRPEGSGIPEIDPKRTYTQLTRNEEGEYIRETKQSPYSVLRIPRPQTTDLSKWLDIIRDLQGTVKDEYGQSVEPSQRFYSYALHNDSEVLKRIDAYADLYITHPDPAPYRVRYDAQFGRELGMSAGEHQQMKELDKVYYQMIFDKFVEDHPEWVGEEVIDTKPKSRTYGKDIGREGLWPNQRKHFYDRGLEYAASSEGLMRHYVTSAMINTVGADGQPALTEMRYVPTLNTADLEVNDHMIINSLGPFLAGRIIDLKQAVKGKLNIPPTGLEPPDPNALGYNVLDYDSSVYDAEKGEWIDNPREPKRPKLEDYATNAEWKEADDEWDADYTIWNEGVKNNRDYHELNDQYDESNPTGRSDWDKYYNRATLYSEAVLSINNLLRNPKVWAGERMGEDGKKISKEDLFNQILLNEHSGDKYIGHFNKMVDRFITGEYKAAPKAYYMQTPITLNDVEAFGDAVGFDNLMHVFQGDKFISSQMAKLGYGRREPSGRPTESATLMSRGGGPMLGYSGMHSSIPDTYGYAANYLNEEEEAFFKENPDFAKLIRGLANKRKEKLLEVKQTATFDKLDADRERQDLVREQEGEEAAQQGLPEPDTPYSDTDVTFDESELTEIESLANKRLLVTILDDVEGIDWDDASPAPITEGGLAFHFMKTINESRSTDQYLRSYDRDKVLEAAPRFPQELTRRNSIYRGVDYIDIVLDETDRLIKRFTSPRILSEEEQEYIENEVMQPVFDEFFGQVGGSKDDMQRAGNPTETYKNEYSRRLMVELYNYEMGKKPDFPFTAEMSDEAREQIDNQEYRDPVTGHDFPVSRVPAGVDQYENLAPYAEQVREQLRTQEEAGLAPHKNEAELSEWIKADAMERLKNDDTPRSKEEVRKILKDLENLDREGGYPLPEGTDVETEVYDSITPTPSYDISTGVDEEGYGRKIETAGEQPLIRRPDPQRFKGGKVTFDPAEFAAELERLEADSDLSEPVEQPSPMVDPEYTNPLRPWLEPRKGGTDG